MNASHSKGIRLTMVYKKSITGEGYAGFIKEVPEAISEGTSVKELASNLLDAVSIYWKRIDNKFLL